MSVGPLYNVFDDLDTNSEVLHLRTLYTSSWDDIAYPRSSISALMQYEKKLICLYQAEAYKSAKKSTAH